jgi:hypothetical protein
MPESVNGNNILLGRGKIYFDRFDTNGARTDELFLGNCPTFEITRGPRKPRSPHRGVHPASHQGYPT